MSINLFFIFIFSALLGMFFYFQPSSQQQVHKGETAEYELENFTIYEITPQRIKYVFQGERGVKFEDRYVVDNGKLTDNTRNLLASIRANDVLYRDDVVALKGDVYYVRADNLNFRSQEGVYDKPKGRVHTQGAFVITKDAHRVNGDHLLYDLNQDTVSADNIRASYQLN
jgi:lipopolysaccharide assembly outer membrane protein LptD (OstA)